MFTYQLEHFVSKARWSVLQNFIKENLFRLQVTRSMVEHFLRTIFKANVQGFVISPGSRCRPGRADGTWPTVPQSYSLVLF